MLHLRNLQSPKGAHKNIKRLGRGQGSGQGTQAGKGHKGQKARTGGGIRIGFEGGQMPLYRRLPKVGFNNAAFAKEFTVLNLEKIAEKFTNEVVTRESLVEKGFLSGKNKNLAIKILAKGEFNKALTFKGIEKFSAKAQELISKAGGKIENA
jgi:large subunit ribosomal protein L15